MASSAPAPADTPALALEATRLAGPAPLAVLFEATPSRQPDVDFPFHQPIYTFDFGDPKAGDWPVSGLPKNLQVGGPLAAHVFDTPGVYKVQVQAKTPRGTIVAGTITITVQDPARIYEGKKTICVSPSGDFAGCPPGASQRTSLPDTYANTRVLLRRGESYGQIQVRHDQSHFQVGAFGEGPQPFVQGVSTGRPGDDGKVPEDWTIMDLEIGPGAVDIESSTTGFLLYRNTITHHKESVAMINIGTAAEYYASRGHRLLCWPRQIFLVENKVRGTVAEERGKSPNLVAMGYFLESAILGNDMDLAFEHTLRIWAASRTVIAHNALGGNHHPESDGIGIRAALKLHSCGTMPWTPLVADSPRPMTSQVILANNRIGSPTFPGSFLSGMGPQNADPGTVEALEDCIAENNVYIRGPESRSFKSELQLRGRRMTARGNTLEGGGVPHITRSGATFDPAMSEWDGPYFLDSTH